MANIIRLGTTAIFGTAVDNASSAWLASAALIDSFEFGGQYNKIEVMNNADQVTGVILNRQDLTMSISGRIKYEPGEAQLSALRSFPVGNVAASELLMSGFAFNASLAPLVDQTIYGSQEGADVDVSTMVPVLDNTSASLSSSALATFSASGSVYKWANVFSVAPSSTPAMGS